MNVIFPVVGKPYELEQDWSILVDWSIDNREFLEAFGYGRFVRRPLVRLDWPEQQFYEKVFEVNRLYRNDQTKKMMPLWHTLPAGTQLRFINIIMTSRPKTVWNDEFAVSTMVAEIIAHPTVALANVPFKIALDANTQPIALCDHAGTDSS